MPYLASTPQLEDIGSIPEDGPLFRAHCKSMEERAQSLRRSLKHLVKSSETVLGAMRILDDAEDSFDRSLKELQDDNSQSIAPLMDTYWELARRVQGFERKEKAQRLEDLILDPSRRLVATLKQLDSKKKVFEQEHKAYYDHVHKVCICQMFPAFPHT